jgi:HSP20 family protein
MLIRWSAHPAEPMIDSWRQLNRLVDQAFGVRNGGNRWARQPWVPAADVSEDEKQFVLTLEVPGVKSDEVKVDLDGKRLTISGQKTEGKTDQPVPSRSFQRVFTLPDQIETDQIGASLADGILRVQLPKTPKPEPRKIEVKAA